MKPTPARRSWPLALASIAVACSASSPEPLPPAASIAAPPPSARVPAEPVPAIAAEVLRSSRAFEMVRSLSDEAGPRLAGSEGAKVAIAWGLRTMKGAGLASVRAEPVTVPRWERGAESAVLIAPYKQPLAVTALGGSVATPPGGIEADVVFVGSLDDAERMDPKLVAGKIAFFSVVTERTRDGSGYGRAGKVRGYAAITAAKLGAVAAVIRSIGTDRDRLPHTGAMRYDPAVPKIPAAALAIPDAELVERALRAGQRVRLKLALETRSLPDAEDANVIGEVKGAGAPDEIVLLGAHLDAWDLGRGAIDDGAGCAIVIEAARQIALLRPPLRRTVRVVLFANEENGLAGARSYAKAHAAEIDKHVVAMEADLGAGRAWAARFLGPDAARGAFSEVARAIAPLGIEPHRDDAHGGADLLPLIFRGVPAIDVQQDATRYFDLHHTANDTIDQIDKADLDHAAAAFTAVAWKAASGALDFGRVPADKRGKDP